MKAKLNKKRIIVFSIILILILLTIASYFIFIKNKHTDESNVIVATKIEEKEGKKIELKYKIEIENYDLSKIEKTLTFETEEDAKIQYEIYKIINENQRKGMELVQDKKKVTIIMPVELFEEEINYKNENTLKYQDENGETCRIISQNELTQTLTEQGYTIK